MQSFNDDILFNIMLNSDLKSIGNLCTTNIVASKYCKDNNFWRNKYFYDNLPLYNKNIINWHDEYIMVYTALRNAINTLIINKLEKERDTNLTLY